MPLKRIFTPKVCAGCGRPIMKNNYVRFAPAGNVRDQQDVQDARAESHYFHHHCWEAEKKARGYPT